MKGTVDNKIELYHNNTVKKDDSVDIFDFLDLKEYLSELIGKDVDLVKKDGLKPDIGKRILSQVVYA